MGQPDLVLGLVSVEERKGIAVSDTNYLPFEGVRSNRKGKREGPDEQVFEHAQPCMGSASLVEGVLARLLPWLLSTGLTESTPGTWGRVAVGRLPARWIPSDDAINRIAAAIGKGAWLVGKPRDDKAMAWGKSDSIRGVLETTNFGGGVRGAIARVRKGSAHGRRV